MKTVLLTVGKAQAPFADADAHYRKLLGRYQPLTVVEARDDADRCASCRARAAWWRLTARGRR